LYREPSDWQASSIILIEYAEEISETSSISISPG
jgi:hypothetical protein